MLQNPNHLTIVDHPKMPIRTPALSNRRSRRYRKGYVIAPCLNGKEGLKCIYNMCKVFTTEDN